MNRAVLGEFDAKTFHEWYQQRLHNLESAGPTKLNFVFESTKDYQHFLDEIKTAVKTDENFTQLPRSGQTDSWELHVEVCEAPKHTLECTISVRRSKHDPSLSYYHITFTFRLAEKNGGVQETNHTWVHELLARAKSNTPEEEDHLLPLEFNFFSSSVLAKWYRCNKNYSNSHVLVPRNILRLDFHDPRNLDDMCSVIKKAMQQVSVIKKAMQQVEKDEMLQIWVEKGKDPRNSTQRKFIAAWQEHRFSPKDHVVCQIECTSCYFKSCAYTAIFTYVEEFQAGKTHFFQNKHTLYKQLEDETVPAPCQTCRRCKKAIAPAKGN
jgi:hypothetical protein